jgi:hypothetical protein
VSGSSVLHEYSDLPLPTIVVRGHSDEAISVKQCAQGSDASSLSANDEKPELPSSARRSASPLDYRGVVGSPLIILRASGAPRLVGPPI